MPWNTSLTTFADGGTPTASQFNQYTENIEWLHAPPKATIEFSGTADFTTTSTTWGTLSGFSTAVVCTGAKILALLCCTGNNVDLDLSLDGTRLCSTGTAGTASARVDQATDSVNGVNLPVLYEGVTAGTHTFAVQWKASSATATIYAAYSPRFFVREL